ncbi:MAG: GNAT family N-acetyltransferase [Bacillota bacterium]
MIKLINYDDISLFKKDVMSFLEQNEAENNLALGVLQSITKNDERPLLMAIVIKDTDIALTLLQTHPRQIILSKAVSLTSKDIHDIGDKLNNTFQEIPGFIGEKKFTLELARHIAKARGFQASVQMDQRVYKLEKVKRKAKTNGKLRKIEEKENHTIKEWVFQFCKEINLPLSMEEADNKAEELIKKGNIVAWEVNGELVSMANATRPTNNNITINYVYTPISERKKGYASDCVSALTQLMLDNGYKTTSLYTDLSNPTSNKIYMEIGYEAIMDSIVILIN